MGGALMGVPVSGTLSGVGGGFAFQLSVMVQGNSIGVPTPFNIGVDCATGNFSGTYVIQRSLDKGATWTGITTLGQPLTFTSSLSESFTDFQSGVLYRIYVSQYTSGSLNYLIIQ
jgi:hypothetical protein